MYSMKDIITITKQANNQSVNLTRVAYLFSQQGRESSCHLNSWLNLKILLSLRANNIVKIKEELKTNVDLDLTQSGYSIEQWIGLTFSAQIAWQRAFAKLTNPPVSAAANNFTKYQLELAEQGIYFEKIYTAAQKQYYRAALNPLQNLQRFLFTPYHFIDPVDQPEALYKSLPIFSDGGQVYIYDIDSNDYVILPEARVLDLALGPAKVTERESVKLTGQAEIFLPVLNKYYLLSTKQQQYLQLPAGVQLHCDKLKPFESKFKYGFSAMYLPEQAKHQVYYHVGLYQLILLALGVDRENNSITATHPLYAAYQAFINEMAADLSNPWAAPEFCKANFFEYQLAEIFKKHPALTQKAIAAIKFMPTTWEYYQQLANLYDSDQLTNRVNLATKYQYLPGEAQILAYSFSMCLRLVWAAAINQKSFRAFLEVPKSLLALTKLPGFPKAKNVLNKAYSKSVLSTDGSKLSFVEVWQEVYACLRQACPQTDFVSFNGHGAVISFADDVLQQQQATVGFYEQAQVTADLKIAIIDSLYANHIKPFYAQNIEKDSHDNQQSKTNQSAGLPYLGAEIVSSA